jgi:N-acetylglucosaminyl-diphospho-decaprenol L-rhamnosyltransferase
MPAPPSPAPARISVVIPTHNTRELTLRCLETVADSEGVEVVVVDDASRDGTAEAISRSWPQVRILRHEQAAGFTRSANDGLRQASGEILLLLNSDTEVEPGGFAALREAFARDLRLGVAGGALRYPDGSPQWSGGHVPSLLWLFALSSGLPTLLARLPFYRRAKPLAPPPSAAPVPLDWVTGAAMAIRREAWDEAGPLDEGFRFYAQDLDLCLRLRRAGWKVEILPAFRVLHHHGATIGKEAGARGHQHPELLWTDLLRWARKSQSPGWARKASLALRWGGVLRLAGRALATPFLPAGRRPQWRAETAAFRRAVAAVRAL